MNAQENKQLVMQGYRLFQSGDIRKLMDLYHDDADWISPDSEYTPYAGSYHGKQGIGQFFAKLDAAVQPVLFEARQFIAEGDTVVVTGDATWIAKSTGRRFDNPWVHVFTMRDGKVARFQAYHDTAPGDRAFHPELAATAAAVPLHH
jgi:uncharacterized protein